MPNCHRAIVVKLQSQMMSFPLLEMTCGVGMNYAVSAIACNPTCLNPNAPEECTLPKRENCVCVDSNAVVVNGQCVSAMTCGCTDDNGIHHEVKL